MTCKALSCLEMENALHYAGTNERTDPYGSLQGKQLNLDQLGGWRTPSLHMDVCDWNDCIGNRDFLIE